jgi:uncharacterized YigZ family protein
MSDTYKTIASPTQGLYKDKGSRFLSYLYPVETEDEIREILLRLKKEHHSARHHCYAWRLGKTEIRFRANDDGEPSSTAGKPILGQLTTNELTDILCIVVRYFGGVLLGAGGLINAYRHATIEAISKAVVETRIIDAEMAAECSYNELNMVMQIMKSENLIQKDLILTDSCRITFSVRLSEVSRIEDIFSRIYGVTLKRLQS